MLGLHLSQPLFWLTFSLSLAVTIKLLAWFPFMFTVPLCFSPFSLSFAGQGEKGDAGIKVGMTNMFF